jgi:SulP family sulfate permease
VGSLFVAGLFVASRYVGDWDSLVGTNYGIMVIAKLLLLSVALTLAALNFKHTRRWQRSGEGSVLARTLPVYIEAELVALVAVMLLLPQSLAYALLAGLPPQCGLYASVLPLVAYAFFGTSRSLSVGPMAVTSLMTASAIAPLVAAGAGNAVTIALQLALLSGFMLMLCGVLRLGVIANLLSSPVNQGFMVGSAVLIILGQVLPLLGLRGQGHTGWALLRSLSTSLSEINPVTALTGITALTLLLLSQHFLGALLCRLGMKPATAGMGVKLVPMLIVIAGIGVTNALSLDLNHGVRVVGPLPQALPALVLPTLSLISLEQLALPAGALALIGTGEQKSEPQNPAFSKKQCL